ncbi:MAG: caspase family protein [Rhodoplanes sp.]|uniref:caspase family protein n=1 Tax=Rhodoplanes sp. TaxID=1968906 RepID=UPI0017AB7550|nr:caspase family protein [Rhodoplanes sp.]NVO16775.1 caspase family protein [Rhodoplanes sp.]
MRGIVVAASAVLIGLFITLPAAQAADDGTVCTSETTPPDQAIAACGRLIASRRVSGKSLASVHFWRAVAFNRKGDYAREIADLDEALKLDPASVAAWNLRGSALYDTDQTDRAIADFNEALRRLPNNGSILHNRANAFLQKKDYARALADYDEAVRQLPREPLVWKNRGHTRQAMGDLSGALADMNMAVRLGPRGPFSFLGRGLIYRATGEPDRAVADFDEVIRLTNGDGVIPTLTTPGYLLVAAHTHRGLAFEAKGDRNRAEADYRAVAAVAVAAGDSSSNALKATARARLALLGSDDRPLVPAATGGPGRRIALVVGNGGYTAVTPLANPGRDARAVAKSLRAIGFDVVEGIDLDRAGMQARLADFMRAATGARTALLFYAGHGMQIDGRNYLAPVDVTAASAAGLTASTLDLDTILAGLDDQIRTNVVILDACRDNPFAGRTADGEAGRGLTLAPGLAPPGALGGAATLGAGTLIAFATAPGQVALDGEGDNSPFSAALVRHIGTPGLDLQQMLTRVRAEVVSVTKRRQVPWSNSSLLGEVFLVAERP